MVKRTKERHIVQRVPKRGNYDQDVIHKIIDEGMICHVSFVVDGQPILIPTIHARQDNQILLHGLKGGRLLNHIEAGHEVCIAITLLDGLVLARSAFHHSMNYRSVVIFGSGREVTDEHEKMVAMQRFVDHLTPGRWAHIRQPNAKEMKATSIVSINIDDASAKIRTGQVKDDDEDYALPIWAGVVPLELSAGDPITDPELPADIETPEHTMGFKPGERFTR